MLIPSRVIHHYAASAHRHNVDVQRHQTPHNRQRKVLRALVYRVEICFERVIAPVQPQSVVGTPVGYTLGFGEGYALGFAVSTVVVGAWLGVLVGTVVGTPVGSTLG